MPMNVRSIFAPFFALALVACTQKAPDGGVAPAEDMKKADAAEDPEKDDHGDHADQVDAMDGEQAAIERTPSVEGAKVFFANVSDGDTVKSPVKLEFGIEKMKVAKAGDDAKDSGHHHLIVDAEPPAMDAPIPANDNYIHFGDGSTSTTLELEPGEHTLRLLLGDHRHIPHDPPVMSELTTITVEK